MIKILKLIGLYVLLTILNFGLSTLVAYYELEVNNITSGFWIFIAELGVLVISFFRTITVMLLFILIDLLVLRKHSKHLFLKRMISLLLLNILVIIVHLFLEFWIDVI